MSDVPTEMTVVIDYGDGSEPEQLVVTPGFSHFHPYTDDDKHTVTVDVVEGDDVTTPDLMPPEDDEPEPDDDDDDDDDIEDTDVVEDDTSTAPAGYDPAAHNVQDVKDYVTANPGEAQAVLDLETASQNRVTLVSWLESFIANQ